MQISLFDAHEAVELLFESWLHLQNHCTRGDNSNSVIRLADHLKANPDSELQVLCVHDGQPEKTLHALCVVETHRAWIASKRTLANWIAEPGLDSTPLAAEDQRYSAAVAILRDLESIQPSKTLALRHLSPQHPVSFAVQAICKQQGLACERQDERNSTLLALKIGLKTPADWLAPPQDKSEFSSLRSLP